MSNFTGGSAYAMVQQVAGGYVLVTERTFKRLSPGELNQLGFEIEKMLRAIRGEPPPVDDTEAIQNRNRKIQRLNSCRMMLQSFRQRWRK
ncbi:MAG: hypothetical protein GY856_16880 [bacterium]|nr:hypothetical protein [bacterium]